MAVARMASPPPLSSPTLATRALSMVFLKSCKGVRSFKDVCRAEKSAEAFREQIFNGIGVPEVSDQLGTIFF